MSVVVRFLQGLIAPWELHRLRRRLPTTPRLWVPIQSGIRPETDAEYLVRLRERAREKKASRSAAANPQVQARVAPVSCPHYRCIYEDQAPVPHLFAHENHTYRALSAARHRPFGR